MLENIVYISWYFGLSTGRLSEVEKRTKATVFCLYIGVDNIDKNSSYWISLGVDRDAEVIIGSRLTLSNKATAKRLVSLASPVVIANGFYLRIQIHIEIAFDCKPDHQSDTPGAGTFSTRQV